MSIMRIIVRVKLTVMIPQLLQKLLSHNTLIPLLYNTLHYVQQCNPQKFNFTLFHCPLHIVKWGTLCKIANAKLQKFTLRRKNSKIHDEKLQVETFDAT